jgi:aldehyde:ferredoxin oxidoreductase
VDLFNAITGAQINQELVIMQSARVYNFQRIFNIRMGKGLREHDMPPYRSMGPVTAEEYESRAERYDMQLKEEIGVDPAGKTVAEKIALHRTYRTDRYNKLVDAVYKRRGWTPNGVPTLARLEQLGIDVFPEVVAVVKAHLPA